MSTEAEKIEPSEETREPRTLRAITWFGVGMAAATLGIIIGRELRKRYKFNRQTPYDYYSNADERRTSEFGMGI